MKKENDHPKLFISYSWTSAEHEDWVVQIATELRQSGVDVILDKWDLKEGQDAFVFMEKMVTDPKIKKVVMVCDKRYAEKADERSGGVGTETQIISREVYEREDQNKFVAIVKELDSEGKPYLPTYYKSRIYIDFSNDESYVKNFEQLLRWIYDKPLHIKPDLGKKPSYLDEGNSIAIGTTGLVKRTIDAIRNNKNYARGALFEYFETLINGLENFRIAESRVEFDEEVLKNIERFIPIRNELIETFISIAQYWNTIESHQQLHHLFEKLVTYIYKPESVQSYREWDFDNFKFIIQELFLYCIASLLKYECFDAVAYLLTNRYYVEKNKEYGRKTMVDFHIFRNYLKSLDYRNKRLKLNRLSLHADLLKQRCVGIRITFEQLMQADFVLFIRDCFETLKGESDQYWWPDTLLYKSHWGGVFEIFSRSESKIYFDRMKQIFEINQKDDFEKLFEAFQEKKLHIPKWQFERIDPKNLMDYENLATRP